ncbi:histidine phosphatase family protein [Metabacillus malikii]|uniref:Broad specificity phosphatase PhoE n=1 Tax=Metabacillus malikii TaxID=1504265 RepID=A0ABT9ZA34_9BACI|nr:histidine phosphatase family protein [Metabacillus malikii]MDQ0229103.1 broad specificity phosphatase PhoE [Metabacillus malikii]
MELYFIRHAQAQHVLNPPESLQLKDPSLTSTGENQARKLHEIFPISKEDLLIISPLRRTIQTALVWTNDVKCQMIVSPLVGPRMFPLLSAADAYACDESLSRPMIERDFPQLEVVNCDHWEKGINVISEPEFQQLAEQFINWCRDFRQDKIYIVSHDGTITSYRQFLGESVTREDFLGDTGWYRVNVY